MKQLIILIMIASIASPLRGEMKRGASQGLLKTLLADSTLTDTTTDGIILKQFMNNTLTTTEVGKVAQVTIMVEEGDVLGAELINSTISSFDCAAANHKIVNEIYLKTWAKNIYDFTAQDVATLSNIALQDPITCGAAIYDARTMLGINVNDFSIDASNRTMESIENTDNAVQDKVGVLYPNPAQNVCTYEASLTSTDDGAIMMYDVTGRLLQSFKLKTGDNKIEMDLSLFNNGIYVYKIIINGNVADVKKLVINK